MELLEEASKSIEFDDAYIFSSVTRPGRFTEDSDVDMGFYGLDDEHFFTMMSYFSDGA